MLPPPLAELPALTALKLTTPEEWTQESVPMIAAITQI